MQLPGHAVASSPHRSVPVIDFSDRFENQKKPWIQDDKFISGVCIFTAGGGAPEGGRQENKIQCSIVRLVIAQSSELF